ncbi:MAG TPA: hypothetical protein VI913_02600 [Candidatus Peribacteraceae bacterium]|nr:hypothetical protein [Candidatus Peribacteraceae bacterium]
MPLSAAETRRENSPADPDRTTNFDSRERKRRRIIEYMINFNRITYYKLGAASEQERDALLRPIVELETKDVSKLDETDLNNWLHGIKSGFWERQMESAHQLVSEMEKLLHEAVANKAISSSSRDKWLKNFRDPAVGYKQKESFVRRELPIRLKNAAVVAGERQKLLADSRVKNLSKEDLPQLNILLNEETFLALHYNDRSALLKMAKESLKTTGKPHPLRVQAVTVLHRAVKDGAMSQANMAEWLDRLFDRPRSAKEIQTILEKILPTYIRNWTDVRRRFNVIDKVHQAGRLLTGFKFAEVSSFLNWHYDARLAYVEEAERRLNEKKPNNNLFGDIRRELDMHDWASAEYLIKKTRSLPLTDEQKRDLQSMETFLRTHRAEHDWQQSLTSKEYDAENDQEQAMSELRSISPGFYDLTSQAIEKGYGTVSALFAASYNRDWAYKNGYLNESEETILREKAKQKTENVVRHGHGRSYENNFVPGYGSSAIRDHKKGENAPSIVHIGNSPGAHAAFVAKCETQQDNTLFKYWTILVPTYLDHATHAYIVENIGWRIKAGMRGAKKTPKKATDAPANASYSLAA